MKKLILIPLAAAIVTFASPFASVAFAQEKPEQAAHVHFCPDHKGAGHVHNYAQEIKIHEKRGIECEHEM